MVVFNYLKVIYKFLFHTAFVSCIPKKRILIFIGNEFQLYFVIYDTIVSSVVNVFIRYRDAGGGGQLLAVPVRVPDAEEGAGS